MNDCREKLILRNCFAFLSCYRKHTYVGIYNKMVTRNVIESMHYFTDLLVPLFILE